MYVDKFSTISKYPKKTDTNQIRAVTQLLHRLSVFGKAF